VIFIRVNVKHRPVNVQQLAADGVKRPFS